MMADKGWDGWIDPEAGGAATSLSPRETMLKNARKRYVWNGTFGEKYITEGYSVIVAYCGCCGAQGEKAFRKIGSNCHMCGTRCWMGPLAIMEETPVSKSLSPEIPEAEPVCAALDDTTAMVSPTTGSTATSLPTDHSSNPTAVGEEPLVAAMGAISVSPSAKVAAPTLKGRGRGRGRKSPFQDRPPCQVPGASASASCSSEGNTPESLHTPDSEPDWKEMDFGPLPTPSLSGVNYFDYEVSTSKSPAPKNFATDDSFWVSPGRADPNKLRTVSRIQRIINIKVFDQWGYYMPYAPEWIYDKVEKSLDEWIYGELLRKEEIGSGGIFHSDPVKRERDLNFLSNVVHEWWYGRTILKHFVKSCGKFQEEKHFALSERLSNGGRIDKPHPNYYLSYKDTRARSCLGKLSTHPSSEEV